MHSLDGVDMSRWRTARIFSAKTTNQKRPTALSKQCGTNHALQFQGPAEDCAQSESTTNTMDTTSRYPRPNGRFPLQQPDASTQRPFVPVRFRFLPQIIIHRPAHHRRLQYPSVTRNLLFFLNLPPFSTSISCLPTSSSAAFAFTSLFAARSDQPDEFLQAMRRHSWGAFHGFALPIMLREARTASAELTAVYVVSTLLLLVACIGCGIYRNRRRDADDLRTLHRAQLSAAVRQASAPSSPRIAGKVPKIYSFIPDKKVADAPCPICLEPLGTLPVSEGLCGHPLHTSCLVQWLVRDPHFSCPVCRSTYETVCQKRSSSASVAEKQVDGRCSANRRIANIDLRSDEVLEQAERGDHESETDAPTELCTSNDGDVVLPMTDNTHRSSHGDTAEQAHSPEFGDTTVVLVPFSNNFHCFRSEHT